MAWKEFERDGGMAVAEVPRVFEEAFGVGAFAPEAEITDVSPTSFKPDNNIDISVSVWAKNPEAWWNTCIVVRRQDTGVVYHKTHGMIAREDDFVEPLVCGKMPDKNVQLEVEIWGHPDYYSSW